jgi:hypothetical protein
MDDEPLHPRAEIEVRAVEHDDVQLTVAFDEVDELRESVVAVAVMMLTGGWLRRSSVKCVQELLMLVSVWSAAR